MPRVVVSLIIFCVLCGALASAQTIIIDDRHARFSSAASWVESTASSQRHAAAYRETTSVLSATSSVGWTPGLPVSGNYDVSVWFTDGSDRVSDACYTVNYSGGSQTLQVDQSTSGGQWMPLGAFAFDVGSTEGVALSNESGSAGEKVIADAVRFVREGTSYPSMYQAMWINSWNTGFLSEAETNAMMQTARENNLNAIFPEVRKTGDAYYISATEPRATNIDSSYTDPLADMIAKAHDTSGGKQYIEVHAWFVPYRVRASMPTLPPGHVLLEHPEWIMSDYYGDTWDGTTQYIDPGVPEVQDYLVDVVAELVQNYDIDGVHFDYFRYPETSPWGYNPVSVARFNALYNKTGTPDPSDPDWCDFRRDQIKAFGRKAYARAKEIRWNVKMSAATITWGGYAGDFTATSAYNEVFQDWPGFMSEGILDINCPMDYKREHNSGQAADYRSWAQLAADSKAGRHAIVGCGAYLNYMHNCGTQMNWARDLAGIDGNLVYCYGDTCSESSAYEWLSWQTKRADTFDQRRPVPPAPWLSSPTFGILCGTVQDSSMTSPTLDGATVVAVCDDTPSTRTTDGSGFYAFVQLPPGSGYLATASYKGKEASLPFTISAGAVTTLDFDLNPLVTPTPTPTPTPTETPIATPTVTPSPTPTAAPTAAPSPTPTAAPTATPTPLPTHVPISIGGWLAY